ncbi:MAG: protein of unknown function (DUF3576) [Pelagibacterales bacterium]|jgi:hypothetical protein|nr:protein of unknown function (DUF3576) [Pelagibacterales bacterium]
MLNLNKYFIGSFLIFFLFLGNCGGFKNVDTRKTPVNAQERARKNVQEGRGISLGGLTKGRATTYQFSSSNPMWRSSLEILDFLPLTTVDYSGGVIITDWYNDRTNVDDSIKITLRFLSNEVQSNSLKIIVHQKLCDQLNKCVVNKIDSKIEEELKISILKKAAQFKEEDAAKKKK